MVMLDNVDRDPKKLLAFAKSALEYRKETIEILGKLDKTVEFCLPELDDRCAELGEAYLEQSKIVKSQLEDYAVLAGELETKANNHIEAIESFRI